MESVQAGYRDRTVAITGASGYLGSALLARLRDTGAHLIATSRRRIVPQEAFEWLALDSGSPDFWTRLTGRADVLFHLAGNTSASEAERDPDASRVATVLPIDLMAAGAAVAGRRPRVVLASTATVYGLTRHLPVDETTPPDPLTTYDRHKVQAEQQLLSASHLDGVVLRLSNVYGPSQARSGAPERGFLNRSIEHAVQGRDIAIYGDGRYLRDFVQIDDVVGALVSAGVAQLGEDRCFNIGSGAGTTLRDAVSIAIEQAARVTGRAVAMRETPWPDDAHQIERRNFVANIDRARAALSWQPGVSLVDGIARFAEHAARSGCAR